MPIFVDVIYFMELKFRKYWEELPSLFLLASVMNPRLNLTGTQTIIKGISNFMNVELSHAHIESMLCEMYNYYAEKDGQRSSTSQSSFSINISTNVDNLWNFLETDIIVPLFSSNSSISRAIDISGTNFEIPSELARYMHVDIRNMLQP